MIHRGQESKGRRKPTGCCGILPIYISFINIYSFSFSSHTIVSKKMPPRHLRVFRITGRPSTTWKTRAATTVQEVLVAFFCHQLVSGNRNHWVKPGGTISQHHQYFSKLSFSFWESILKYCDISLCKYTSLSSFHSYLSISYYVSRKGAWHDAVSYVTTSWHVIWWDITISKYLFIFVIS